MTLNTGTHEIETKGIKKEESQYLFNFYTYPYKCVIVIL